MGDTTRGSGGGGDRSGVGGTVTRYVHNFRGTRVKLSQRLAAQGNGTRYI